MASLLVIVSYKVFPAHMGGQKGIVLFYDYLKIYHRILMAVSTDNEAADRTYSVERILYKNNRIWQNLLQIKTLRRLIRIHQVDCIVAEHSYTGWIALILKKLTGKPFIIHSHNIESSRFRQMGKRQWKLYDRYERWIHRKADFSFFKTEEERQIALQRYSLQKEKCGVVPYGIEAIQKIVGAKESVRKQYGIGSRFQFYFNGTLDYEPNRQAVICLLEIIVPSLVKAGLDFTLLISGKRMDLPLLEKINQMDNVRYLDLVDDVALLYQAADLFLNPVTNDSGVKTKMVEALANHCTVVSTESGAAGIPKHLCPEKIFTAKDGDWQGFVNAILQSIHQPKSDTPSPFFHYFAWQNIAVKAAGFINATISHV